MQPQPASGRSIGSDIVEQFKAVCRMCHGGCGTIVERVNGTIRKVIGDRDNPINRGALCSKAGTASIEQLYHPDRLDYPLMRVGARGEGKWRRISWDEAISYIAERMQKIKAEHGAEAVAFGRGTGINNTHIVSRLANLFGTPNITAIAYFCYGPRVAVSKVTASGNFSQKGWDTTPIPDVYGKPRCIVQWGSQKRTSNDHGLIGHTPLTDALNRKPINIVVDPRKPKPAGPVDIWLALRPATDAAMALGWMNVIINEELYDKEFVENYCHGFEALRQRVQEYPLHKVADITWCDPELIAQAARTYATTRPGALLWGNGTDQLGNNTFQATRSLLILMGLTGNIDAPGGNAFYPAGKLNYFELWDKLSPEQAKKRIGGDRFKALNMTPYAYAHPPALYQAMLSDKPYPVKAYIVVGNNTVTCFPNTGRIIEAMKKLDLLVVQDIFMTPTAEYADIVLPAAGNLEREEPRFHLLTKGPQATFIDTVSRKLAELGERRSDWEFIIALGRKLGFEEYFPTLEEFANEGLQADGNHLGRSEEERPRGRSAGRVLQVQEGWFRYAHRQVRALLHDDGGVGLRSASGACRAAREPGEHARAVEGLPADPQHRRQAADVLAFARPPAPVAALAQYRALCRDACRHRGQAGHQEGRLHLDRDRARETAHAGHAQ